MAGGKTAGTTHLPKRPCCLQEPRGALDGRENLGLGVGGALGENGWSLCWFRVEFLIFFFLTSMKSYL